MASVINDRTYYIHEEPPSFAARALQRLFALLRLKKGGLIIKATKQTSRPPTPQPVPQALRRKFNVQSTTIYRIGRYGPCVRA